MVWPLLTEKNNFILHFDKKTNPKWRAVKTLSSVLYNTPDELSYLLHTANKKLLKNNVEVEMLEDIHMILTRVSHN